MTLMVRVFPICLATCHFFSSSSSTVSSMISLTVELWSFCRCAFRWESNVAVKSRRVLQLMLHDDWTERSSCLANWVVSLQP